MVLPVFLFLHSGCRIIGLSIQKTMTVDRQHTEKGYWNKKSK